MAIFTCSCPDCMNAKDNADQPGQDAGGDNAAKPWLTPSEIVEKLTTSWSAEHDGLTRGWDATTITYSMPDATPTNLPAGSPTPVEASGIIPMTTVMKNTARLAFELWDDLIAVNLDESAGNTSANIVMNHSTNTGGTYALTQLAAPVNGNESITGVQIWADADWATQDEDSDFFFGGYGLETYVHEIGHALGLSHPGHYNGSAEYDADAEFAQDSRQYSVMSYFGRYDYGLGNWTVAEPDPDGGNWAYPSTPMLFDILAIQEKYGADMTTRTGNTTYGFNCTANRAVFDFTQNDNPIFTIWDAGGIDTLDASGYYADQYININDGLYSDIGGLKGNVAIAYNCVIENARGGFGEDLLIGTPGDNRLDGGGNNDVMKAGYGDDIYVVDNIGDEVDEYFDQGVDQIHTTVSYTLPAYVEQIHLKGTGDINATGNGDSNWLFGNIGDNRLDGAGGADAAYGGAGNDTYVVNHVNDFAIENASEGTDTVEAWIDYTLPNHVEALMLMGVNNLNGNGNGLDNVLLGNVGSNTLDGKGGADMMYGGLGGDTYVFDHASDVAIEFADEGIDTVQATLTTGLGGNLENLALLASGGAIDGTGNGLANIIVGNAFQNVLTGNGGNDTLDGLGGADTMIGGLGDDSYSVDNFGDVVTENANEGVDWAYTSINYALSANVEKLSLYNSAGAINGMGNSLDNFIYGNSAINVLSGLSGKDSLYGNGSADTLNGGAGEDMLDGGSGADTMDGGADSDSYYVDSIADTAIEAAGGGAADRVYASVGYVLGAGQEIEFLSTTDDAGNAAIGLTGNALSQTITGNAGMNTLKGGGGADTLIGLGGNDTYYIDSADAAVVEAAGFGNDRVLASVSYALGAGQSIEQLATISNIGTVAINLTGNALAQTTTGNDGNNWLDSATGAADTLAGRSGNDSYLVRNAGDVIVELAGQGSDWAYAAVNYTLSAGAQVESLSTTSHAGTAALNLTGNALAQTITGNDGNNWLDSFAGVADTLAGRSGNDSYLVRNAGDTIVELAGQGSDWVYAAVSYTLTAGAQVENLSTTSHAGMAAIDLTGNALAQTITGNDGNNWLNSATGAADTLAGRSGNDSYLVRNAGDTIVELAGQGSDWAYAAVNYALSAGAQVENLSTTSHAGLAAIDLTGNALAQTITGNDGNNWLDSFTGAADTLAGRSGNDSYLVRNAGDTIVELAGQGSDWVYAAVSYTLSAGAQVENLSTTSHAGTAALNLAGNALAQTITGNDGVNVLNGGGGNDILNGRGGADTFVFNTALDAATNVDTLLNYSLADDIIYLENAVFAGLANGALAAGAFRTGAAAADADDRIIYNDATGALIFDVNGNAAGGATQFATLSPGLAMNAAEFFVV